MSQPALSTGHPLTMNAQQRLKLRMIAPGVPAILIDDFFVDPHAAREYALGHAFKLSTTDLYPGSIAPTDAKDPTVDTIRQHLVGIVNTHYLPRIPLTQFGEPIETVSWADIDFATVNLHPRDLQPAQSIPHVDGAAIFGLVYLNPLEKGGTLFFDRIEGEDPEPADGYCNSSIPGFALKGKIDGVFNRLALYPGFVYHTGEIAGDWITDGRRMEDPRLTMRAIFGERG